MIISVIGTATILEEVTGEDAANICNLRNDPRVNRFLSSQTPVSVEDQKKWMTLNAARADNFYFKVSDKRSGNFCGTISLYIIKDKEAEFGRYICNSPLQAMESEFLLLQFGFKVLSLDTIYCRTVAENKSVWNQHYKYGFEDKGTEVFGTQEMVLNIQEINKSKYESFDYSFVDKLIKRLY